MQSKTTLMRNPDNTDEVREVPLNQWQRYRAQGWEFANDAKVTPPPQEEKAEEEELRRTEPKSEEEEEEEEEEAEEAPKSRRRSKPKE